MVVWGLGREDALGGEGGLLQGGEGAPGVGMLRVWG